MATYGHGHSGTPTLAELDEFRNVLALARAAYMNNRQELDIVIQLITHPDEHIAALRAVIHMLLTELDTSKRDASEVLTLLIESAACADATK